MSTNVLLGAGNLQKFLKKSLALVSAVFLSVSLMGNVAFAAEDDYTVTGGNPGALPAAGAAAVALPTLTITDTDGDDFGDDPSTIRVAINTTDYPNVIFNNGIANTDLTIAGDCGYTAANALTYNAAATQVDIPVINGTSCATGQTITIAGLEVSTIFAQAAPAAAALVTVDNFSDNPGSAVATSDTVTLASAAGALTATNVQPNTLDESELVSVAVSFTTPGTVSIPVDGKIVVIFGAGFTVDAAANGTCSTMDGNFTTTDDNDRTVTITRDSGSLQAAAAESCSLTGIRNPTTTGTTGTYTISVTDTNDNIIYTDAAVAADTITNSGGGGGLGGSGGTGGLGPAGGTGATGTQETTEGDTQETTEGDTQESMEGDTQESMEGDTEESMEEDEMMEHEESMQKATSMTDEDSANADNETPFEDVDGHWATGYINLLYDMGVVSGRTNTSFVPNTEMTRAEIVKIALLTFGYAIDEDSVPSFTDVGPDDWYAPYLAAAESAGIVEGYEDGTFHPNASVNRAEALKILLTAGGFTIGETQPGPFDDVDQSAWYAPYVNYAYTNGVVSGKTNTMFAPGDNITRAEMSKIAVKAYGLES